MGGRQPYGKDVDWSLAPNRREAWRLIPDDAMAYLKDLMAAKRYCVMSIERCCKDK